MSEKAARPDVKQLMAEVANIHRQLAGELLFYLYYQHKVRGQNILVGAKLAESCISTGIDCMVAISYKVGQKRTGFGSL